MIRLTIIIQGTFSWVFVNMILAWVDYREYD